MVMQIIFIIIFWGGWGQGGRGDKKIVMVFSKVANVEQSNGNKFSVTSFMYLYSCTLIDHGQRTITARVAFIV